jgi:hypothetical protein
MKKALLTGIAALLLATGAAHADDYWGMRPTFTCGQFNKLNKIEKDKAISWALGYIVGMAPSYIEKAKRFIETGKAADLERANTLIDRAANEPYLLAAIQAKCLEQPNAYFPVAVEWTYVE